MQIAIDRIRLSPADEHLLKYSVSQPISKNWEIPENYTQCTAYKDCTVKPDRIERNNAWRKSLSA